MYEIFLFTGTSLPSRSWASKISFEEFEQSNVIEDENFLPAKTELEPQGVDPKRGWNFRGVHKVHNFKKYPVPTFLSSTD